MSQLARFLIVGGTTVAFYVGGVWFGTEVMALPARPVNIFFYVLTTIIAFVLAYIWVFSSQANKGRALVRYFMLHGCGVILNALWLEAGLRFTPLYPWIIAAAYFAFWPFISFTIQRRYVFS